jgi:hypothetical protein
MAAIRHPPDKSTVSDGVPGFADWFGEPRGGPIVTNPYSTYPRETLALPEVYKGSNPYLTNVMITIIEDEQLVPTRVLLPIRQTQNETSITWDEFHFNNTLLGPVPEEGVSRLVTQQISERRDHYVRYGLAFMIEHGFMLSPKGRLTYKMNLEQIRDAILQSLYIGVIEALLRCKTNSHIFMQCYGKSLTAVTARKRLDMEVESWAEIQKTDYGWDMLNSRAQKILKLNGVTPDAWIVDDGIKKYIAGVRRENWAYFIKGPNGPKAYEEQLGLGDPKSLDVASGVLIFECKQFNLPQHDDAVNIMSRRRTIGEYNVSFPHVDYSACKTYSSAFRDILVYDEDRDGLKKISIQEGLDNCVRFDDHTGDLSFPANFRGEDMFKKKGNNNQEDVKYLGEMNSDDLTTEAIRDWTMSVISGLENDTETARDIAVMKTLVAKLEATPEKSRATTYYFHYVYMAHAALLFADSEVSSVEGIKSFDPTTGVMVLPTADNYAATITKNDAASLELKEAVAADKALFAPNRQALYVPYGYGTHVGIKELANVKYKTTFPSLHEEAVQAMRGFNALVQRLETVCYDNKFMRSRSAPFFFKKKDIAASIFSNLVHERVPPLCISARNDTNATPIPFEKDGLVEAPRTILGTNIVYTATLTGMELLKKFTTLLNPANYDKAMNAEDPETLHSIKRILEPAMEPIKSAFGLLNPIFRNALYLLIQYYITGNHKHTWDALRGPDKALMITETKAAESSKRLEWAFTFIMKKLGGLTAKQLHNLLSHDLSDPTIFEDKDYIKMDKLLNSIGIGQATALFTRAATAATMRNFATPGDLANNPTKDFITQLTCSENMESFLTELQNIRVSAMELDPEKLLIGQIDMFCYDKMVLQAPADFANIRAGGDMMMDGEMIGVLGGGPANNRFGIKRKHDDFNDEMQPTSKNHMDLAIDPVLAERMAKCKVLFTNGLHRAVSLALLGTPVTKQALSRFIQSNVVFPFNVIYARPYMTYDMSTGVCMKAGSATGETLVGHADFQLGDNVVQKLHYGNFTFYSKSVVYRQQNVYLAEDMFSTGYVGGCGSRFFTNQKNMEDYSNGNTQRHASIFAMLAPYMSSEYNNPIDITGAYSGDLHPLGVDDTGLHYASAGFYKAYWNWSENSAPLAGRSKFDTPDSAFNTICFQGHQSMYNPSNSMFDLVIKNTGHWGDRVYPGCGKVRQGMSKVLEPVHYNNIYGGGGNVQGMTALK